MQTMHIAKGELWLQRDGAAPQRIESAFAREVVERDAQSRRTSSWKGASRDEQQGVIPTSMLWGKAGQNRPLSPPRFLQACQVDEDTVYYLLAVGESVGLFRQHLAAQREVRLFHRADFNCLGFDHQAQAERFIAARANPDGTAHLEVYDIEGNCKGPVTGGDCIDAAPSYVPGERSTVVFQSAGVARHPQGGHVMAVGHACINRLDYASGRLETLVEDKRFDHIAPRVGPDGALYMIRRPFEKPVTHTLAANLKDTLMFPWRLLKAVFGYLNFFSTIYGREPLRSSGGPRTPELDQDLGRLWLHGRMIELSKLAPDAPQSSGLVPRSWELVRRDRSGAEEVLARHVVSFDLAENGQVVYSNGFELFALAGAQRSSLGRCELVERVGVLKRLS